MKRLRFIDDYCRVKESLLSTSFGSPSGSGECPLQHVKCQKVTAHTVLSHALNMRFQGVLAAKSCESELFWDIRRGCDVLWHFTGCEVFILVVFATVVFRISFHACHSERNWATTVHQSLLCGKKTLNPATLSNLDIPIPERPLTLRLFKRDRPYHVLSSLLLLLFMNPGFQILLRDPSSSRQRARLAAECKVCIKPCLPLSTQPVSHVAGLH